VGSRLSLNAARSMRWDEPLRGLAAAPLLLQDGRLVLNGTAEGFGAAFQQRGRRARGSAATGVALAASCSRGGQCWVQPLQETGPDSSGEWGLAGCLNLDGGGSTGFDGRWGDDRVGPLSLRLDSTMVLVWCHGIRRRLFPYTLSEAAMRSY